MVNFALEEVVKAQRVYIYIYIYSSTHSLTSAIDEVGGQSNVQATLPPGKRPGNHGVGGWAGPMAGVEWCGNSYPHRDSIPGSCNLLQVATPTELSWSIKFSATHINYA